MFSDINEYTAEQERRKVLMECRIIHDSVIESSEDFLEYVLKNINLPNDTDEFFELRNKYFNALDRMSEKLRIEG